jgi:hypothetical protein
MVVLDGYNVLRCIPYAKGFIKGSKISKKRFSLN